MELIYSGANLQWSQSIVELIYSGANLQWSQSTVEPIYCGADLKLTVEPMKMNNLEVPSFQVLIYTEKMCL